MLRVQEIHEHYTRLKNIHWKIKSGFHHVEIGRYLDTYLENSDRLVEACIGAGYKLDTNYTSIFEDDKTVEDAMKELSSFAEWLTILGENIPLVATLTDDMTLNINRLLYLLDKE